MLQPEFLPTQIEKLWKAMNANQKQIATVTSNNTYSNIMLILLKIKQLIMGGFIIEICGKL